MAQKKISVIIPCYNVSPFIDRCMESLEKQTIGMDSLEIIMVNDASEDATLGKILLWEMKYPDSLVVLPLQEHVMQGAARNIARNYCTGEYIAFLDADDWILPSAFEKLYRVARQNNADFVNYLSKKTFVGPEEDDPAAKSGVPDSLVEIHNAEERLAFFNSDIPLARGCWDKLFRREFVEENDLLFAEGVFDEESLYTIPAYMKARRIYLLNEYLHRYYQNLSSTCFNLATTKEHRDDNARTWIATYNKLKDIGALDENQELIEKFFIINYFIRSFIIAIGRKFTFDADTVKEMQDTVHELFPHYQQNKSLMSVPLYREPVMLIDIVVNEDNIDSYNEAWQKIVEFYGEYF